jgi:hypothetical protein
MDHGHAHPSTDSSPPSLASNDLNRLQTTRGPLSFLGVSNTSSPLPRSPQALVETSLSLPQRRLQLRNAGFRAPRLPSHRLSTRISRWFSDKDDSHSQHQRTPARSRPTSPSTVKRKNTRGSNTPGSILHEITNSTHSRNSETSTFGTIYENDQDRSPTHSWYHDAPSTQQSPITSDTVRENANEMKLREISGNAPRSPPPLSSPLARQIRGRNKRGPNLRKTSFPASEHIVFLETKLEEVEKSQYSPNTGLSLKDKNKALAAENNRLQEMLAELEHQFETRLRESVEHKTGLEMSLRRRVKQLEEEVGSRDCTIRDLEYRNDASQRDLSNAVAYKAAVERLESEKWGLEETNRSLEKRNDVLTELLGQSPTRSHHGFELPSPVREHHKRTPRPRSMMPRIPSSPAHSALNRPLSLHTLPTSFQHDYFSPLSALSGQHDNPYNCEDISPYKDVDDSQSIDSGLGESCSVRSGKEPISKRSSMHSHASGGLAAWGLPLPPSPTEEYAERSARKRKTRRFASGSTQLKPLVLPTLNTTTSLPQSAPLPCPYSSPSRRDISEHSIDPTLSFLSQVYDTPTQSSRRPPSWAAEEALKALEPSSEVRFVSFEERLPDRESSQSLPRPALDFRGLSVSSSNNPDLNHVLPNLVDDVILEEDATALLDGLVEDAGDQSFSALAGEASIAEPDIDRQCAEEQTLAAQFLGSELPFQIDLQLHCLATGQQLLNDCTEKTDTRADLPKDEELSEPAFMAIVPVERDFANPLASAYLPLNASFQCNDDSHQKKTQLGNKDEHEVKSGQSSQAGYSSERPVLLQRHSTGIGLQSAEIMMPNPLKAAPSESNRKRPKRPRSPFELLQDKGSPTISLTSVTTRTIFGTISRYTSYMREMRRDPTALGRRVIANAWWNNWRRLGKLSWWVLGLFLGPGWKQQVERRRGWEAYDGENIAQAEHGRLTGPGPSLIQDTHHESYRKLTTPRESTGYRQKRMASDDAGGAKPSSRRKIPDARNIQCKSCEQRRKTSWGRSLYLWGKFSVAIMLAVGGAVINGPEEMLKDCDLSPDASSARRSEQFRTRHSPGETDHDTLSDYSLDDDGDEDDRHDGDDDVFNPFLGHEQTRSPVSIRTAKSATRPTSRHKKKSPSSPNVPLFPADTHHHTLGAPSPGRTCPLR